MRVLTTAAEINAELTRLLRTCSSCRVAVAWASVGFEAFDLLAEAAQKIERMVVGTHFHQTHPDFIEAFLTHPNVRFVLNPSGVFHPKVYFFETAGGWECLVGSPNFTAGGMDKNDEVVILVNGQDVGAPDALAGIMGAIDGYWRDAVPVGRAELAAYRQAWQRRQPALRSVAGRFGNPDRSGRDDGGRMAVEVPILRMTWDDYFRQIEAEAEHARQDHSMEGRLKVVRAVRSLFAAHRHFCDIGRDGRRRIAGLAMDPDVNYLFFGSMKGGGRFQQAVNDNNRNLSLALDMIPAEGQVPREAYLGYTRRFRRAFPAGGGGIGTATRLLAMKRPDVFVCLDKMNRVRLCAAFGIGTAVGYEAYWDSIIERVMDSTWWNSPPPPGGAEREVWDARAAFLDSLFYEGNHPPPA